MSSVLLCCSGTPESILAQVAVMATGFFITCYWRITKLSKKLMSSHRILCSNIRLIDYDAKAMSITLRRRSELDQCLA